MLNVQITRTGPVEVPLPAYQTRGAAGMDLCAALEAPVRLEPGQRKLIATGLRIAVPEGYEAQVRPRSGLALRQGITVLNSPGTVDSDYRGEVCVLLVNLGDEPVLIAPLERIAQVVFSRVERVEWTLSESLETTERGTGGYGSTGLR